jgi:hypothetical protein
VRAASAGYVQPLRLKVDAMHPEVAGDQNYDDYYANYGEDIHSFIFQ